MTITNEKLSFTVTKLKDDRIVIDSPYESTSTIIHPMLVISSTVIQLRDKKLVNTLPSNTTIQFQCVGILGILDLTFGRYLLLATEKKLSSTLQSHKIWSVTKAVCLGIGFNINPHDTTLLKKMTQEDLARVCQIKFNLIIHDVYIFDCL